MVCRNFPGSMRLLSLFAFSLLTAPLYAGSLEPRIVWVEGKPNVEVRISGKSPARGEGASKRAAEQAAASELLTREGVMGKPPA